MVEWGKRAEKKEETEKSPLEERDQSVDQDDENLEGQRVRRVHRFPNRGDYA